MKRQTFRHKLGAISFAALLVLALVYISPAARAAVLQQAPAEVSTQAAPSPAQSNASSAGPSATGTPAAQAPAAETSSAKSSTELAKQSKEAAGEQQQEGQEDETAQFKRSDAVRWIAQKTGMTVQQAYITGVVFNFAVFALVIIYFSVKGLPKMFRARTVSIQQSMLEARKSSEEARRRLSEIENRLSHLDSEIAQLRASAEREAAVEEERIRAAALEDSKRIVESAEQEIAAATKAARRELTKYASGLAVSLAQKQIRVDAGADERLVGDFLRQLNNGNGKGQN